MKSLLEIPTKGKRNQTDILDEVLQFALKHEAIVADLVKFSAHQQANEAARAEEMEHVEKLLKRIELKELLQLIDFDKLTTHFVFPDLGVNTKNVRMPKLEGLPEQPAFFSKIFGLKQGRAIIPHGHKNRVHVRYDHDQHRSRIRQAV